MGLNRHHERRRIRVGQSASPSQGRAARTLSSLLFAALGQARCFVTIRLSDGVAAAVAAGRYGVGLMVIEMSFLNFTGTPSSVAGR